MIAPGITETILPIDLMQADEEANIVELCGDECQVHRLAEMGLCVGACVRMVKPGAPCLLALEGKRLSVRLGSDIDVMVATS